jgi:hypothetical protein
VRTGNCSGAALVLALVGLCGVAAGACSGGTSKEQLSDSLTLFTDAMRWAQWDTASSYVAAEKRKAYLEAHDKLADLIDISDLEVTRRVMAPDGKSMTVVITLSWLAKNDPVLKKTVLEQRWEPRSTWVIVKEKRLRGDPLPEPPRKRQRPATQAAPDSGL